MHPSTSTASREPTAVATRLRELLTVAEGVDPLDELVRARFVTPAEGLATRELRAPADDPALVARVVDDELVAAAGAIGRVDPRTSRATLSGGRILGMYVQDCGINTEAEPPYHRLPSLPALNPYHIVYLLHFAPNETHTVHITLQVFSAGGSVRITATGNQSAMVLGQSSVPITVPMTLTTNVKGFASIFIQRNGATGFDWFATDVF